MKFAIVAVIACLCFATVAAAPEPQLRFNIFKWVEDLFLDSKNILTKAMADLETVDCVLNDVVALGQAAENFPQQIEACGGAAATDLSAIYRDVEDVVAIVKVLINVKSGICPKSGSKGSTPLACFNYLVDTLSSLLDKTKNAVNNATTVKTIGVSSEQCIKNTIISMKNRLTSMPEQIRVCNESQ